MGVAKFRYGYQDLAKSESFFLHYFGSCMTFDYKVTIFEETLDYNNYNLFESILIIDMYDPCMT